MGQHSQKISRAYAAYYREIGKDVPQSIRQ